MRILHLFKNNPYLGGSIAFHIAVIVLFSLSFSFRISDRIPSPPPIIIDLRNVEIAPKTNLPPTPTPVVQEKPVFAKAKPVEQAKPQPQKPDPKATEVKLEKTAAVVEKAKPLPKKEEVKKPPAKAEANELSSLLASVAKMKTTEAPARAPVENTAIEDIKNSVKGGIGGDYKLNLTITEQDAIASKLRSCWNLDAGAKGVLDMTVELRAYLNRSGRVTDVKILDNARYSMDNSFRAIADSARRAVYVCDKRGAESPFMVLPEKYPQQYDKWQELYLKFNPLDGGVF